MESPRDKGGKFLYAFLPQMFACQCGSGRKKLSSRVAVLPWISRETAAFIDKLFRFGYPDKGINGVLKNSRFFGSGLNFRGQFDGEARASRSKCHSERSEESGGLPRSFGRKASLRMTHGDAAGVLSLEIQFHLVGANRRIGKHQPSGGEVECAVVCDFRIDVGDNEPAHARGCR